MTIMERIALALEILHSVAAEQPCPMRIGKGGRGGDEWEMRWGLEGEVINGRHAGSLQVTSRHH